MTPLKVQVMRVNRLNYDFMLTWKKLLVYSFDATSPISDIADILHYSDINSSSINLWQLFSTLFQTPQQKASSLTKMHYPSCDIIDCLNSLLKNKIDPLLSMSLTGEITYSSSPSKGKNRYWLQDIFLINTYLLMDFRQARLVMAFTTYKLCRR